MIAATGCLPHRQPEALTQWEDALRTAGMPE